MEVHRINRIEIELYSDDAQRARALSERVAGMHRGRLAPLLDRVCGELGGGAAPVRIDRLEVDLGVLSPDSFEEDLLGKLEPALRATLSAALARRPAGGGPRAEAALELLETFALTGGLPWWADPGDGAVVARHFAQAAALAEPELVALVRRLAGDPGALDRLARACDGDALAALAERGRDPAERAEAAGPLDRGELRALLGELAQGGPRRAAAAREASRPIERLEGAEPGAAPRSAATPAQQPSPRTSPPGSSPSPQEPTPPRASPVLPSSRPPAAAGAIQIPDQSGKISGPPPAPDAAIRAARRAALARLDELYVDDAGLVILWPFLERCFARTGLLGDDRRFLDEAAQLSAVALASALATADPEPPEVRLPLAKLLCGRPLESDFRLDRPLTPAQLAEGDRLLAAVIDRAPALGELSIPGLRAAFLQRPGALGTRDGAWLLQVERRAHDVVLERLPWSWAWVKLPWMPDPLRVEW